MKRVSILPVIHFASGDQVMRNAAIAAETGCDGVFLIHMNGDNTSLALTGALVKERHPDLLVGTNHLGEHPAYGLTRNVRAGLDMTWTDDQLTHSDRSGDDSVRLVQSRRPSGHLMFTGVAFKHQKREDFPATAAKRAVEFGFIPTTSGSATGVPAEMGDLANLRAAIGNAPLAVASGVDPRNFATHAEHVTHVLVATGISSSFYEFDASLLYDLVRRRDRLAADEASSVRSSNV